MKTKIILVLCLIMGIGMAQLSAQGNQKSEETKTYVYKNIDYGYWAPVYCGGNLVDELWGTVKVQFVIHVENGMEKWDILIWSGELKSSHNDEIFRIQEIDKIGIPAAGIYTYHFNLKGNMGSHYINSGNLNMSDWTIVVDKTVCPGN